MQRYIRGLMLAGTAVVAWGCADNPIADGADDPAQIVASPSAIFVDAGETVTTTVEVQNDQGAALESQFSILNVDAGITAVIDSTFNPYYDKDGNLVPPTSPTRIRVLVTGGADPGVYSFDVAAGGLTSPIATRVLPISITGAFSNAAPACNAPVTYTVEAPYIFATTSFATVEGGVDPYNQSVAPDGSSITFTPAPGTDGSITISDVELDFLPGAPVDLLSDETITVGTACGFTGIDAAGTSAPAIPAPAIGSSFTFFDDGTQFTNQWYKITVTESATYEFELQWNNGADVDLVVYNDNGGTNGTVACSHGTLDNPEICAADLDAGTYYVRSFLFGGAAPSVLWVTVNASASGG